MQVFADKDNHSRQFEELTVIDRGKVFLQSFLC